MASLPPSIHTLPFPSQLRRSGRGFEALLKGLALLLSSSERGKDQDLPVLFNQRKEESLLPKGDPPSTPSWWDTHLCLDKEDKSTGVALLPEPPSPSL